MLAGGGQLRSGLVAHEQLAIELVLEHAHPGAHRGLRHVEVRCRAHEAARLDDFEEGPGSDDVHLICKILDIKQQFYAFA